MLIDGIHSLFRFHPDAIIPPRLPR
jgi:hypothetical protein